ncbi:MAG: hypothetical protein FWG50_10670 [Kiritimatiellaeota bacterium]|nr:hypothetical protein [Kiritimatiellota bacterium]
MLTTRTNPIEEMVVPVPDYIDRFLTALAEGTGKAKEDIALFFLLKEAEHASPQDAPSGEDFGTL